MKKNLRYVFFSLTDVFEDSWFHCPHPSWISLVPCSPLAKNLGLQQPPSLLSFLFLYCQYFKLLRIWKSALRMCCFFYNRTIGAVPYSLTSRSDQQTKDWVCWRANVPNWYAKSKWDYLRWTKSELTGKPESSHLAGNYAVFLVTVLFKRKEEPAARSLVWLRADHIAWHR